ncbi:MAG: hypothetical protein CVU46_04355 [Chloroflexi bacterium HGW-Chloroflexi-8]|nr:MAG: hypothetical protein CVU46_04355 [Chloroflexi bacterium HGW-Chloroflexi-8]
MIKISKHIQIIYEVNKLFLIRNLFYGKLTLFIKKIELIYWRKIGVNLWNLNLKPKKIMNGKLV